MTLTDFATFSTGISGLALAASLFYLALQTHQNAKHTRALIHQGRVTALRDVFLATASPDTARAWLVATGAAATPHDVQHRQFLSLCGALFYGWQDTYSQYRSGLLDEDFFRQMRKAVEEVLKDQAARDAWAYYRLPDTPFTDFMDDIAASLANR